MVTAIQNKMKYAYIISNKHCVIYNQNDFSGNIEVVLCAPTSFLLIKVEVSLQRNCSPALLYLYFTKLVSFSGKWSKDGWGKYGKSNKEINNLATSSDQSGYRKLFRVWNGSLIVTGWLKKTNVKFINQGKFFRSVVQNQNINMAF